MNQRNFVRTATRTTIVGLALSVIIGADIATPAQAQGSGDAACLYMSPNFRGERICVDNEIKLPRLRGDQDDQISSFDINPGWGLRICQEPDFGGWCRYFTDSLRRLRDSNNAVSSVEVFRILTTDPEPPPVARGVVCLFEHRNYGGDSICVDDETRIARLQPWDDDQISSFRVRDGWQLRVCRDRNFRGWCREFTGDEPNLRASNDAISSFQVSRVVVVEPPRIRVACLFSEPNFGGLAVCSESAERISDLGPRLNDRISSIRLAPGWSMVVCNQPNMQGRCARVESNAPTLGSGFDNRISSYQVFLASTAPVEPEPVPEPEPDPGIVGSGPDGPVLNIPGILGAIAGEVCLFEHSNFRGRQVCGRAGTEKRSIGGGFNDKVSSVRVPQGLLLLACEHNDFGGTCRRFDRDTAFLGGGFNDRISSYRITPNF